MNNETTISKPSRTFWRDMAIRKALKTSEQEDQAKKDLEWFNRTKSSDQEVVAAAFREDWVEIEKLVESEEDKVKLKRKFGIT